MTTEPIKLRLSLRRGAFNLDVDLQIPRRGITAIFGRSGSGKTSLLRCIAGLEADCRGEVVVGDQVWQGDGSFVPTHKRPLGYVIQTPTLFPHLSVRGNLEFAERRAAKGALVFEQVTSMLGVDALLDRNPARLSGGERQRVAIARALLVGPQILLMDEPMASLDRQSKKEIMPYLERLHRELDIPVIYVSHSADEVARLADYLVVMDAGRAVAQGQLAEMLTRLDFPVQLDDEAGVVWEGRVTRIDAQWHLAQVNTAGGDLWVRGSAHSPEDQMRLRILARDVSLSLSHHEDSSILNILSGEIEEMAEEPESNAVLVRIRIAEATLLARITARSADRLKLQPGMFIWAQIKSVALV